MEFLKIILTSAGSVVAMFVSAKVIGNKQMSELSMFDYINGITIGSIAAEMATSLDGKFYYPLTAIAVYTVIMLVISRVTEKNVKLRRFLTGRSILLMQNGKIYPKNFKTAKIDISDFLVQCRLNGFFSLDDINTAILEQNGKISFLPSERARPVQASDFNISAPQQSICCAVIVDGHVMAENLKKTGNNIAWLEKEVSKQKIGSIKDVFIALCDDKNNLSVYKSTDDAPSNDPFQ